MYYLRKHFGALGEVTLPYLWLAAASMDYAHKDLYVRFNRESLMLPLDKEALDLRSFTAAELATMAQVPTNIAYGFLAEIEGCVVKEGLAANTPGRPRILYTLTGAGIERLLSESFEVTKAIREAGLAKGNGLATRAEVRTGGREAAQGKEGSRSGMQLMRSPIEIPAEAVYSLGNKSASLPVRPVDGLASPPPPHPRDHADRSPRSSASDSALRAEGLLHEQGEDGLLRGPGRKLLSGGWRPDVA